MNQRATLLEKNLRQIQQQIADASRQAGRNPDDVKLLAVTKYASNDVTRALVSLGCEDLGESRPQVLWKKAAALHDLPIRWHQIGHLQRNKLRRTLPITDCIHSVDSVRLLRAIESVASELDHDRCGTHRSCINVFLEINISGEQNKTGFHPDACDEAVEVALELENVRVQGLMGMAGLHTSRDGARRDFAALRELREQLQQRWPEASLGELSMGMSRDFAEAIAEGSTIVRIGSALFRGIDSDAA